MYSGNPQGRLRQPPNLRKMMCRAALSQPKREDRLGSKTHRLAPGWKKCERDRPPAVHLLFPRPRQLLPRCEYIGLTARPFTTRLGEHKQYIRSKTLDYPSGGHFNQQGHELSHLAGLVLEHVKSSDPFVLRAREYLYIQKFDTFRNGLNGEQ